MSADCGLAKSILIMAGGTGGHVFPALALARLLREQSYRVVWLGTRRGLEARIVPAEQFPIEWISIGGLRGKGRLALLVAPVKLLRALVQALGVMRRHRPAVVVGLGGFVTGPGGVAAWLLRRPLLIHEQNAVAGFTNRCLARLARRVFEAFPGSFGAGVHAELVGNPVRREFFALAAPALRFAPRTGPIRLLVVGGSQGAARLNAVVPPAVARAQATLALEVRHQAGERGVDAARAEYVAAGVSAEVLPFIEDIAAAFGWADLVICRAGALTVSELAAAGLGAILVPFPAAVDDHQTANARTLVEANAAVLIAERDLEAPGLAAELLRLCHDRSVLLGMAERAHALARPRAALELAHACTTLAGPAAKSAARGAA
jgi:UDP-N-acetylglucosamine--N-acetylmuramyl-(pentapeptide) pyrophosphoryl-undecaprenol N-acetylglucosamine transferase